MKYPNLLNRFQTYVQIDTQSDPHSSTVPSTEKQKDLARVLAEELKEMGVVDVDMDDLGYVYATVPASPGHENAPAVVFVHIWTLRQNILGLEWYPRCITITTEVN